MSVRPSVRLSVCPSVRPSAFSGLFSNMLWDINLKLGTVDSRYLAPVGSQNLRAPVKWFSRYLALSREGHDSRLPVSQTHIHDIFWRLQISNSMLSDNRGTYVSRISTHRHHTSDKSQQATLDFNNYATKLSNHTLVRQHTMDSVLKSAKPRRGLTGSRNVVAQAGLVSPKSHELLGDKFANCISNNSDFDIFDTTEIQNRIRVNGHIDLWTLFVPRNVPCIAAVSVFRLGWSECDVTYGTLAMAAIVCWQSEADYTEPKSEPNVRNRSD